MRFQRSSPRRCRVSVTPSSSPSSLRSIRTRLRRSGCASSWRRISSPEQAVITSYLGSRINLSSVCASSSRISRPPPLFEEPTLIGSPWSFSLCTEFAPRPASVCNGRDLARPAPLNCLTHRRSSPSQQQNGCHLSVNSVLSYIFLLPCLSGQIYPSDEATG